MNAIDLVGAVGASLLRGDLHRILTSEAHDGSTARYSLHQLTGPQVAAIARAVTSDAQLAPRVTLRVPRALVRGDNVPPSAITDENAAFARNAPCSTPVLVLANTLDSLGDTLGQITKIGAKELKEDPGLWVAALMPVVPLPSEHGDVWSSALSGLLSVEDVSLDQFAAYIDSTRIRILEGGQPLVDALGWALPVLNMPRDSGLFLGIKGKDLTSIGRWKKLYQQVVSQRRPLLRKQFSSRGGIDRELLQSQFERARHELASELHPVVQAFIESPPGWNEQSRALADHEWEKENVRLLFDGLRKESPNLGKETEEFFKVHEPDALSAKDREYLEGLAKRKSSKDPREDDVEFYEAQRTRLAVDRTLRAKWDRFIYGKGIEHTDFQIGLLLAVQKLYAQAESFDGPKQLSIRTQKKRPKEWLDINFDVLRFFSTRYRGLCELTADFIKWDTGYLFKVDELQSLVRDKKKYKFTTSTARNHIQLKFELELRQGRGATARPVTTQLVWLGRPNAIGMELADDLKRVADRPFWRLQVDQRPVSKKGALQSVALDDAAGTLAPAYGQDAGSLVSTAEKSEDLERKWSKSLDRSAESLRVSPEGASNLREAWKEFAQAYTGAIAAWQTRGVGAEEVLTQARLYGRLLALLRTFARGDLNRAELWLPILRIGVAEVLGGRPAAIVVPWHPLRLLAAHVRLRSLAGLLRHIFTAESVNFGDERLFFTDLAAEFEHPYYPEVVVGLREGAPTLLAVTETLNDYSLAELPVREGEAGSTNENPNAAAGHILGMVQRFLDLQPHEHANLTLALYNCDSTGLPIATVAALSSFREDGEVRCSVTLRHYDTVKLGALYGQLLESVDADPDAVVASESSRDFMAKLRIGIMLDPREGVRPNAATKAVDIAFLQDVVSRRAKVDWLAVAAHEPVEVLDHVPARWSYKRSSAEDELKSTSYLTCPRQSEVGWAYLDALFGTVRHLDVEDGVHRVPVRQIVFQDGELQKLFREVHDLAEWVVNYDDLLDKRQLLNQGVKVIRHQRDRSQGRTLLVSSTSPLRLLEVLVKRRLGELNLDLSSVEMQQLARRLIEEASAISGAIILRAAKRGVAAGELIGLVLSKVLVEEELRGQVREGTSQATGWYFLDDYASWLNQKEGRIADLFALSPVETGGQSILRAVVCEAKYVNAADLADARRVSAQQLEETVLRMGDALFGDPGRLDRDLWLSRLSDLLLDAVASPSGARVFDAIRDAVRQGALAIDLRAYSHVFISGPESPPIAPEQGRVPPVNQNCLQEVFPRETVRRLLRAYVLGQPLTPIRASLGDDRPWERLQARIPATPVSWIERGPLGSAAAGKKKPSSGGSSGGAPAPDPPAPSGRSSTAGSEVERHSSSGDGRTQHLLKEPESEVGVTTSKRRPPEGSSEEYSIRLMNLVEENSGRGVEQESTEWIQSVEQRLRTALLGYHLGAQVVGRRITPNAALIRFQGSDKLSVEQVEKRRSELLTTHALQVISITARPGEIVIAVARPQRETVSLWDILARRKVNRESSGMNRSFVLGTRELDGELLYLNLGGEFEGLQQHAPHTLIAGATGSGKSVLVQNMILDICATNSPELAQILIVDPKLGVDYAPLRDLPHLKEGIIVDRNKAQQVLAFLCEEMDRRYALFASKGAKDLQRFNAISSGRERLPAVWLVHDEFAEWMLMEEYRNAVTEYVSRLGTKARAAGIYLIFAAQRPDNNVFPMQLRDNLGNRLVLRVESVGTSEIALKMKGAERLLGKGHLAASLTGEPDIIFAQVPYMSEEELARAATAIINDVAAK